MPNTAAVIPSPKVRFEVQDRPIPKPLGSTLLVHNAALATNPVDYKIQDDSYFITIYPNVLGSDIAGTVSAIGPDVKRFNKGDRVTGFASVTSNNDIDHGAFQQYTLLNENSTAKIPDRMSLEEGAILPMAVATSGVGIFLDLRGRKDGSNAPSSGNDEETGQCRNCGDAAIRINTNAREFGAWLFNEFLEKGLVDKTIVPSPAIEKVEGGIASVQKALDLHRKGLSGKKLVISLS
ncbi:MAG: hypothetical protein L6R40_004894 [Gallowayella cf. fulva]|nr:MAG: hypothetical protein L6R40_004894 [Xanthomendoza cf. fulva]